jgi:23S rRNA (cytidine1920-2'-O)/16S rRNA (cytidine1409-2'-O)-methyltransferase
MDRLDTFLYKKGFTQSRNRAKELIENGSVLVDNRKITKPSFKVFNPSIEITSVDNYVSRAAYKLKAFLLEGSLEIEGRVCLDIGSSTGGFIEVLLEMGAKRVIGVDVGRDQLHKRLKDDNRVESYEGCDIREFDLRRAFEVVTCDLSFIGSENFLNDIDRLASRDIVILFKPQFEVGRDIKRDKKGVVKDSKAIILAKDRFLRSCTALGWNLIKESESKLKGKEGNLEIFYHFRK